MDSISVVNGNDKVVSVNMQFSTKQHIAEFCERHYGVEKFLSSNGVLAFVIFKPMWPVSNRPVVMDNMQPFDN